MWRIFYESRPILFPAVMCAPYLHAIIFENDEMMRANESHFQCCYQPNL
jgi:hypothetical protein